VINSLAGQAEWPATLSGTGLKGIKRRRILGSKSRIAREFGDDLLSDEINKGGGPERCCPK